MYCRKCGNKMEEGDRFCGKCGDAEEATSGDESIKEAKIVNDIKGKVTGKENRVKTVIIVALILLAIAIITAITNGVFSFKVKNSTPEEAVRSAMRVIKDRNADGFIELIHPTERADYKEYMPNGAQLKSTIEYQLAELSNLLDRYCMGNWTNKIEYLETIEIYENEYIVPILTKRERIDMYVYKEEGKCYVEFFSIYKD